MSVRLVESRLRGALVEARVPFRFGIAEMNELVHVLLFVTVEIDGTRELGVAADNLPPKWFTKNPETSYRDDVAEMLGVIESACAGYVERLPSHRMDVLVFAGGGVEDRVYRAALGAVPPERTRPVAAPPRRVTKEDD
jgi:hypothetical protein